jgi:hypothetical protein
VTEDDTSRIEQIILGFGEHLIKKQMSTLERNCNSFSDIEASLHILDSRSSMFQDVLGTDI